MPSLSGSELRSSRNLVRRSASSSNWPRKKITRHGDAWIVDFGQNMVGHVRLSRSRARRHHHHAAPRRNAQCRRLALHGQPPPGQGHRYLHPKRRRRRGDVRAALHFPRFPLCRSDRLPGRLSRRRSARHRRRFRHAAGREPANVPIRDLNRLYRKHRLESARQFPQRADRLPAARRAHGLDGRRAGFRPHRRLQRRRRRLFRQVDGGRGRRPKPQRRLRRRLAAHRPASTGLARLGRRRASSALGSCTRLTATRNSSPTHYPAMVRWVEYCRGNSNDFIRTAWAPATI